jgi:hypothetical protein
MDKKQIAHALETNHNDFINYLNQLSEKDFEFAPNDKWSAGQQMQHIVLSVKPLVQVLVLPKGLIRMLFGVANRNGRTYDGLVERYNEKLQKGGRATGRFVPKPVYVSQRKAIEMELRNKVKKLVSQISNFSDDDLDKLILPHPLLGKITIREMLYFTVYHVSHHKRITERNLIR